MGRGENATYNAAPTTPAPNPADTAKAQYEARLKYDPLVARQEMDLQKQYMPEQTELYSSLYNQYMPQMSATQQQTQKQLYPYQSQIVEQGAQDALSRLMNPNYMSPQEQQAQDANRGKAINVLQQSMRDRANIGGTLYGGRSAQQEAQGVGDLLNQFTEQDYSNRMNAGVQAQQALNPYMQILYPQVGTQQPQVSPFQYQSAVPGADTLYNAYYQASQPQYLQTQPARQGGLNLGLLGRWGGATY